MANPSKMSPRLGQDLIIDAESFYVLDIISFYLVQIYITYNIYQGETMKFRLYFWVYKKKSLIISYNM